MRKQFESKKGEVRERPRKLVLFAYSLGCAIFEGTRVESGLSRKRQVTKEESKE
jgi:hypothetical protein